MPLSASAIVRRAAGRHLARRVGEAEPPVATATTSAPAASTSSAVASRPSTTLDAGIVEPTGLVVDPISVAAVALGPSRQRRARRRGEGCVPTARRGGRARRTVRRARCRPARRRSTSTERAALAAGGSGCGFAGEPRVDTAGVGEPFDQLAVDALVEADARAHPVLGAGAGSWRRSRGRPSWPGPWPRCRPVPAASTASAWAASVTRPA